MTFSLSVWRRRAEFDSFLCAPPQRFALCFPFLAEVFPGERLPQIVCQQGSQGDSRAVGGKVQPVAASVFRTGGLKYFNCSAHKDRENNASGGCAPPADGGVPEQVFDP